MVTTLARGAALTAAFVPTLVLAQRPSPLPLKLEPRPTVPAITRGDLMTRLYRFADDSMGGRSTGSVGHVKATDYIAAELQRMGIQPGGPDGSYFQQLPVVTRGFVAGGSVRSGERRFLLGEDFGPIGGAGSVPRPVDSAEVVIGGVLGDSSTWIGAEEARGKIVLLTWNPRRAPTYPRTFAQAPNGRFADAAAVVMGGWDGFPPAMRAALLRRGLGLKGERPARAMPLSLIVSDAMLQALASASGSAAVHVDVRYEETEAPARNVIGILPGADPRLRGQYVAMGAHSDHDPISSAAVDHDSLRRANARRSKMAPRPWPDATNPARLDSIKNGADDDGSGSVALLEIAEWMASTPYRPRRSMLFVWHVGEELGLWGADYFTMHPTVPLDSVVAQLNMDMIGRGGVGDMAGGGPQFLLLVGSRRLSRELGDIVEDVNRERRRPFRFDYSWDADGHPERIYCRSDHAMYARYGVPVTFFHTGLHLDYHQVTDEPQYIDYVKLQAVTELVKDVAVRLGDRDRRPRLNGPRPSPTEACRQ